MNPERRRFLRLLGLTGVGGLAGCTSFGSNDPDTATKESSKSGTATAVSSDSESLMVAPTATLTPTTTASVTPSSTPKTIPKLTPTPVEPPTDQASKIAADDGDSDDRFGYSVAMSGDRSTAIIGAYGDDDPNGDFAGSTYVFSRDGESWSQEAKLSAADGDERDFFGYSVAVSEEGSTAIIGARYGNDPNGDSAGSSYVFSRDEESWSQEAKLTPADGESDKFGESVAVSGEGSAAIIGAYGDNDPNGDSAGSAYVFSSDGQSWSQETKLSASDGDSYDGFGQSVAVSHKGSTAIIGAYGDDDPNGNFAGSAYVFSRDGESWSQEAKLSAADGDERDSFGYSVAVSDEGSTAIIGAHSDEDPNGCSAGSGYVFSRDGQSWSQEIKLSAADGDSYDRFGLSVAVSDEGSTAIIGAHSNEEPNGDSAGSAYVFE